ncbi:hypothetical protein BD309DRAFT_872895 [Dichomitus squalens]|uniref:Uncharacterized protein n=1 Tax=Dichomitus squalens TaxID=114155 RepID=A0A4Q9NFD5_9APHY|nr:hypothetical protein BD309DRAFT_872895 [Dichomitus squalens]TBU52327.1 hypothetical protein BD310DRAFT_832473 [Dichomitus squalens]
MATATVRTKPAKTTRAQPKTATFANGNANSNTTLTLHLNVNAGAGSRAISLGNGNNAAGGRRTGSSAAGRQVSAIAPAYSYSGYRSWCVHFV